MRVILSRNLPLIPDAITLFSVFCMLDYASARYVII